MKPKNHLTHRLFAALVLCLAPVGLPAETGSGAGQEAVLEPITVHAQRVANLQPATSYANLATELRFHPRIALQSRGLPEGQSDVTVRGGLFENTGFRLGAVSIFDPQTGHYAVEVPLDTAMLTSPEVLVDADNGLGGFNASVATVSYGFKPIRTGGSLSLGVGSDSLAFASVRAGRTRVLESGRRLGTLVSASGSSGDGTLPYGDHDFKRFSGQVQVTSEQSETNFLAGYHDKFFGWPGAYTGFAFLPETDHTRLGLLVIDHRREARLGWWEIGASYRQLEDDYDFDRKTTETGVPGSFEHKTRSFTVGLMGEARAAGLDWAFSGQWVADRLVRSTDLVYGDFNSRQYLTLAVAPGRLWALSGGRTLEARAGIRLDWSNRDEDALLPLFSIELEQAASNGVGRLGISWSRASQLPGYTALKSPPQGLFGGNADLGREYANTLTASAAWEGARWEVRGAVFHRRDDDLVDWTYLQGAPFRRQANPVDIEVNGAEVMLVRYGEKLDLVGGYTWLDKDADYGDIAVDASYYALNYARHRITLAVQYRPSEWFDLRLDSAWRSQQDNPLRTGSEEAFTASFSASWRPHFAPRTSLSLVADNLTDNDFEEFPGTPAMGRQLSVMFGFGW